MMATLFAYPRANDTVWVIEWKDPQSGNAKRQHLDTTDRMSREAAQGKLAAKERDLQLIRAGLNPWTSDPPVKLYHLIMEFLAYWQEEKGASESTISKYAGILERFHEFTSNIPVSELRAEYIQTYLRHRMKYVADTTVASEYRTIKAMVNYAQRRTLYIHANATILPSKLPFTQ